jgi:hypothetical protein
MCRTACTEPQCLYKGALFFTDLHLEEASRIILDNKEENYSFSAGNQTSVFEEYSLM